MNKLKLYFIILGCLVVGFCIVIGVVIMPNSPLVSLYRAVFGWDVVINGQSGYHADGNCIVRINGVDGSSGDCLTMKAIMHDCGILYHPGDSCFVPELHPELNYSEELVSPHLRPQAESMIKEDYFQNALMYSNEGKYDEAIAENNKFIETNPSNRAGYLNRGMCYEKEGNHERAIADFTKAIGLGQSGQDLSQEYTDRAYSYYSLGKFNEALQDLQTIQMYGKECTDLAEKLLDSFKNINLKNARFYNNRGNADSEKGDYDQAIRDYNQAIELNSDFADAYHNRAIAYYDKQEYRNALEDVDQSEALGYKVDTVFRKQLEEYRHSGIGHDECDQHLKYPNMVHVGDKHCEYSIVDGNIINCCTVVTNSGDVCTGDGRETSTTCG